ncbi:hypothetical protein D3C73_492100 [compost metagenome]
MELRLITKEDRRQAIELADATFRTSEQDSMGDAFPFIYSPGISHSYGAFDEGRLVSFMGLVPSVVRVGGARLSVFSLGSVCTHPDYRGQGLAGSLLELCKQHAQAAGASLLFVSGDRSLYTRAHCYPFGQSYHYTLDASTAAQLKVDGGSVRTRLLEVKDFLMLQQVASSREVAFEQSVTDLQLLISGGSLASCYTLQQHVYVTEDSEGQVLAFLIVGVPFNEGNGNAMTIEWGGPADQVELLLGEAMHALNLPSIEVAIGWHEEELIAILTEAGLSSRISPNSGTVCIINEQQLLKQVKPYLTQEVDGLDNLSPLEVVNLLFNPDLAQVPGEKNANVIPLPYLSSLNFI